MYRHFLATRYLAPDWQLKQPCIVLVVGVGFESLVAIRCIRYR
jgi:hypothetical protein